MTRYLTRSFDTACSSQTVACPEGGFLGWQKDIRKVNSLSLPFTYGTAEIERGRVIVPRSCSK